MAMHISEGENKIIEWLSRYSNYLIPAAIILFVLPFINFTYERNKCDSACTENGYHGFRYKPAGRGGVSACFCLSKEESEMTNKIPKGTKIEM